MGSSTTWIVTCALSSILLCVEGRSVLRDEGQSQNDINPRTPKKGFQSNFDSPSDFSRSPFLKILQETTMGSTDSSSFGGSDYRGSTFRQQMKNARNELPRLDGQHLNEVMFDPNEIKPHKSSDEQEFPFAFNPSLPLAFLQQQSSLFSPPSSSNSLGSTTEEHDSVAQRPSASSNNQGVPAHSTGTHGGGRRRRRPVKRPTHFNLIPHLNRTSHSREGGSRLRAGGAHNIQTFKSSVAQSSRPTRTLAPYEIALLGWSKSKKLDLEGSSRDTGHGSPIITPFHAVGEEDILDYDVGTYCRFSFSENNPDSCGGEDISDGCFDSPLHVKIQPSPEGDVDEPQIETVNKCLCKRGKDDCTKVETNDGVENSETAESNNVITKRCGWDDEYQVCVSFAELLHTKLERLLAKRGKKDLALKIRLSTGPARVSLPYGPYGPQILGHGKKGLRFSEKHPDYMEGIKQHYGKGGTLPSLWEMAKDNFDYSSLNKRDVYSAPTPPVATHNLGGGYFNPYLYTPYPQYPQTYPGWGYPTQQNTYYPTPPPPYYDDEDCPHDDDNDGYSHGKEGQSSYQNKDYSAKDEQDYPKGDVKDYGYQNKDYPKQGENYLKDVKDYSYQNKDYPKQGEDYLKDAKDYGYQNKDYPKQGEDYVKNVKDYGYQNKDYPREREDRYNDHVDDSYPKQSEGYNNDEDDFVCVEWEDDFGWNHHDVNDPTPHSQTAFIGHQDGGGKSHQSAGQSILDSISAQSSPSLI